MAASPKSEGPSRTGHLNPKCELESTSLPPSPTEPVRRSGGEGERPRFLTREELAGALQVSLRTVDTMVLAGEIPHLRLKGYLVRFYLPDVVRHLTATALTCKRRWPGARPQAREVRSPKSEVRGGTK
jgi:excisionase family DNA binding protein